VKQAETVKTFEELLEEDFHKMAEELTIVRSSGSMHGVVDVVKTDLLHQAFSKKNGVIDWKATYNLRKLIQQGHYLAEQNKRDGL
jgi:hypothetical protein